MAHEDVAVVPVFVSAAGVLPETAVERYETTKASPQHPRTVVLRSCPIFFLSWRNSPPVGPDLPIIEDL